MHSLSSGPGAGFWGGVTRALAGLGQAVRVLLGLALLSAAFVMGLLLAVALVLRATFGRGRQGANAARDTTWRGAWRPTGAAQRRPTGEVVDVEAREVGPGRQ